MQVYNAKKEDHFIQAYQKHFAGLTPKRVLEIGVQGGGSLKIWRDMFPEAQIVGVDVDPSCAEHAGENIAIHIGDQTDERFLETLGEFDIIIDDGGHKMSQQQVSFNLLMPRLAKGGIYVIEDTHTSYWEGFLDLRITTVEMLKGLIDDLHEYADRDLVDRPSRSLVKKGLNNKYSITSLHVYPGITFIYK
jgi:cephalosporin hydroxylase